MFQFKRHTWVVFYTLLTGLSLMVGAALIAADLNVADALGNTAVADMPIQALMHNTFAIWMLKWLGVGTILKAALSLKINGVEVIDYLPAQLTIPGFNVVVPLQTWYPHLVIFAITIVFDALTSGFPNGFGAELAGAATAAGLSGSAANSLHDWWVAFVAARPAPVALGKGAGK